MALEDRYQRIPFDEAIDFLRQKINVDTDSSYDILDAQHDAAFVVAGAKGSVLSELREAVTRAMTDGQRLEDFQERFNEIAEGWEHKGDAAWRARVIYQTNVRQAHAAGRYQQQLDPEVLRVKPYLQYIHGGSNDPRPSHIALHEKVFRAEELPFYPPNGYGCSCRTISLGDRDLSRFGLEVSELARGDSVSVQVGGKTYDAVLQPDPGFDNIPGQSSEAQREEMRRQMLPRMSPEIRAQVEAELNRIDAQIEEQREEQPRPEAAPARQMIRDSAQVLNQAALDERREQLIKALGRKKVEAAERKFAELLENSEVQIRISPQNLERVLESGRFKSSIELSESGSGKGEGYNDTLRTAEGRMFGDSYAERQADERPIYGYWSDKGGSHYDADPIGEMEMYGSVAIRLRPEATARASVSVGDSAEVSEYGVLPSSVDRPNIASLLSGDPDAWKGELRILEKAGSMSEFIRQRFEPDERAWVEAQIHGQVSLEDFGEIMIGEGEQLPDSVVAWAEANGIAINRYSRPQVEDDDDFDFDFD